jgi:hypothetical protein
MNTSKTIAAVLLMLGMSGGLALAQSANSERGPISHPTAAIRSDDGSLDDGSPGPTNPNPNVNVAPQAKNGVGLKIDVTYRPDTTTDDPAQLPSPH